MTDTNAQELLQWMRLNAEVSMAGLQIDVMRLWAEELAKPRHADPKRLLRYGFKVYSQNEEDGIIQEIFKRVGATTAPSLNSGSKPA